MDFGLWIVVKNSSLARSEKKFPLVTFRSRASLETLELRLSLRRGKDWEYSIMELAWLEVRRANWDTFTKLEVSKVNREY